MERAQQRRDSAASAEERSRGPAADAGHAPEAAPAAAVWGAGPDPVGLHGRGNDPVRAAALLEAQQTYGNRAVQRLLAAGRHIPIQRDVPVAPPVKPPLVKPPLVKRPEDTATYEEWMASFSSLTTFTASDTAPGAGSLGFEVYGDTAASHDETDPAEKRQADPLFQSQTGKLADHFVDHPTDKWIRANLPDELREMAYRLPTDCADIAVILRHVWLFSHNRTERHGSWVLGVGAGSTVAGREATLHTVIGEVYSGNVKSIVNAYSDAGGNPILSFKALQHLLHPGDILVWQHQEITKQGRIRTGGDTRTVVSITRAGGKITSLTLAQGNEPVFKDQAAAIRKASSTKSPADRDPLRDAPGRRIEKTTMSGADLLDFEPGVWSQDDGPNEKGHPTITALIAAGPPAAARRAKANAAAPTLGQLSDWLPVLGAAKWDALPGAFEAALQAARATLEGGGSVDAESARALGEAAGGRLFALDHQRAPFDEPAHLATIAQLRGVVNALASGAVQAPTQAAVRTTFALILSSLERAALRNEVQVGNVRRIPVDGLALGQQPAGTKAGAAAGRAVVLIPTTLGISATAPPKPVEVLLHFHGRGADLGKGAASRDVTVDHIEQQLQASGRPMIAVLPQGTADAKFGAATFDANAYLDEVFARLTALGVWPAPPKIRQVVLSAHSGGGFTLTEGGMLGSAAAPNAAAGKPLGEVALFDAINGPHELTALEDWLFKQQLPADVKQLQAAGTEAKQLAFLRTSLRFRAYHTGNPAAKPSKGVGDYAGLHAQLEQDLAAELARQAALIGASSTVVDEFVKHYKVIAVDKPGEKRTADQKHDQILGDGNLQDALGALH